MLKNMIVLGEGESARVICSGVDEKIAIRNATVTKSVNDGTELNLGSVCSSMLEMTLIAAEGELNIPAGTEFTLCEVDDAGEQNLVGKFVMEKPTRSSANTYKITAYDRVVKLDKDVTEWFNDLDQWPYTLYDFAVLLCTECGLDFKNESIPNGDRLIQKFDASGITGRQLMKYVAQAACRFGRATVDGQFELAWYSESGKSLDPSNYHQNGLSYEEYETYPIERVQIRVTESDVGTLYPTESGDNTYPIEGNPLLTSIGAEDLLSTAETIYNELSGVTYTPCKCILFYPSGVEAGEIISITDRNGKTMRVYVMTSTINNQKQTIECTGSYRLDSITLKNNESLVDPLYGKMLELGMTVDGALVRVTDLQAEIERSSDETVRQISEISVRADGIASTVSTQAQVLDNLRTDFTAVQQSATDISLQVQSILENGVDKVSNSFGLTIDGSSVEIHREGSEMTNLLNENGMYVIRSKDESSETIMLKADAAGVEATDVKVNNYLIIAHSRFEKYSNGTDTKRTGLFWVEEG